MCCRKSRVAPCLPKHTRHYLLWRAPSHQPVGSYLQHGGCIDSACLLQDAQSILEEVYRAAPVPEEYMKYQLHLSTGMEVPQIELWFQNRRSTDGSSGAPVEGESLHCSC